MFECEWFSFVKECDIPNWVIGILGFGVAIIIFVIQHRQERKINEIIIGIDNKRVKKKQVGLKRIGVYLKTLGKLNVQIISMNNLKEEDQKVVFERFKPTMSFFIQRIQNISDNESNVLPSSLYVQLELISSSWSQVLLSELSLNFEKEKFQDMQKIIDNLIKLVEKYISESDQN